MKLAYLVALGLCLSVLSLSGCASNHLHGNKALTPAFSLRPTGGIDVGGMYLEVVHFNPTWVDTEEHDVFKPSVQRPTSDEPDLYVLSGPFPTPGGSFKLTQRITAVDTQASFSAEMDSKQPIATNEMSVAFSLPVKTFGGKQITVDGQPITMPLNPATKDMPTILEKTDAHQIALPTPTGTLEITGDLNVLVQDDRPWGDPRYALRLHFTPGKGPITQSKIDFQMKWTPTGS